MGFSEAGFGDAGIGEVGFGETGFGEVGFGEMEFGEAGAYHRNNTMISNDLTKSEQSIIPRKLLLSVTVHLLFLGTGIIVLYNKLSGAVP